jgi:predicted phage terminase large subunit-like protein
MISQGSFNIANLERIVIGVDPSVTNTASSDECGIIVVGRNQEGIAFVLDDLSLKAPPTGWAKTVIEAYHSYRADRVVAEVNMGGDLVQTLLRTLDPTISYKAVRAHHGKHVRAEPIAALYEQGKVFHTRYFHVLETQMCSFSPGNRTIKSPDRMDALVWALTELMLKTHPIRRAWNT